MAGVERAREAAEAECGSPVGLEKDLEPTVTGRCDSSLTAAWL